MRKVLDKELDKMEKSFKKLLIDNGYVKVSDYDFVNESTNIKVTVLQLMGKVEVFASWYMVEHYSGLINTKLTNSITFHKKRENDFDMYAENGTPEEIFVTMINDFIKKKYYLEALMNGKELQVCEKPSIAYFHNTDVPF